MQRHHLPSFTPRLNTRKTNFKGSFVLFAIKRGFMLQKRIRFTSIRVTWQTNHLYMSCTVRLPEVRGSCPHETQAYVFSQSKWERGSGQLCFKLRTQSKVSPPLIALPAVLLLASAMALGSDLSMFVAGPSITLSNGAWTSDIGWRPCFPAPLHQHSFGVHILLHNQWALPVEICGPKASLFWASCTEPGILPRQAGMGQMLVWRSGKRTLQRDVGKYSG